MKVLKQNPSTKTDPPGDSSRRDRSFYPPNVGLITFTDRLKGHVFTHSQTTPPQERSRMESPRRLSFYPLTAYPKKPPETNSKSTKKSTRKPTGIGSDFIGFLKNGEVRSVVVFGGSVCFKYIWNNHPGNQVTR